MARVARAVLLISLAVALLGIGQFGGSENNPDRHHVHSITGLRRRLVRQCRAVRTARPAAAYGEVDPKDPLNAVITDIELAPRNSRGNVEYSMDISILQAHRHEAAATGRSSV